MKSKNTQHEARFTRRALSAALILGWASAVGAMELDSGNPDLKLRWDNTVRYNLGARAEGQDSRILKNSAYDESDAKFGKNRIVTNRLDLLTEFDANYKSTFGARVSAAGWYDHAYSNNSVTAPAGGITSYYNNQYNAMVKRYVEGPSGEILDAFVWSNFDLGVVPVNVKLGRHTIVWGEGLLLGAHAISYSQAPVDGQKALGSPGIETKEVFLPLNQLSFKAQATNNLTLAGQYFLEWKPTRAPNGGTYLMGADTAPNVDRLGITNNFAADNIAALKPGNRGNWGLSARYNAEPIESTLGLYYRRFNDYNPETGIQFRSFTQLVPGVAATTVPSTFRFVYPKDVSLVGLSFARAIGPVSFGSELSYRQDGQLNSKTTYLPTQDTGARGDTLHAVINGVYLLPKTPLWDTGSVIVELAYARLQRITENANLYRGVGYASCVKVGGTLPGSGDHTDACSTRDFTQIAVNFTPQYLGILPSWDLDLPVALNYGLKGNSPTASGGFEKVLSWSIGAKMTYQAKHEFSLRYSDLVVPGKYNVAGNTLIGGNALGGSLGATDRGWLVFTYKTSF
jgi:hypothetical protein